MAKPKSTKAQKYTSDNIDILEGLDGIRQNPGMYLGALGDLMLLRMIKEIVDNWYDEHMAGRNKGGEVYLNPKKDTYIIADYAGGIPVGIKTLKDGSKLNSMTAVFTRIHAGGKNNQDAYKTSAGTHGVGSAAVTACCEKLEAWSFFGKVWHYQSFTRGEPDFPNPKKSAPPKDVMKCLIKTKGYGTIVRLIPDHTVIAENASRTERKKKSFVPIPAKATYKTVGVWLRNMSWLNPGLEVTVSRLSKGKLKSKTMINKKGLEYIPETLVADHEFGALGKKPFVFKTDFATIALHWTDHTDDTHFKSFVNSSPSIEHGMHVNGFKAALDKAIKPHEVVGTTKGKAKPKTYKREDLMMGLVGFFEWKMHGAQFSGQIKDKLESKVDKEVEETIQAALTEYFEKNKSVAKMIIRRAVEFQKQVEGLNSVMKSLSDTRKKSKGAILADVLTMAPDCKVEDRELYIVEGDSAGGTANDAREPDFQEVLKLRGKPLNTVSASLDKIVGSKVIQDLLVATGLELKVEKASKAGKAKVVTKGQLFSTDNMRVGRVILMADADPDGYHIATMLVGFFNRFCPDFITAGRLFVVDNPLFSCEYKGKYYGAATFAEVVKMLPKGASTSSIGRLKGLGEMNGEALGHYAMDIPTRRLYRILPAKTKELSSWFTAVVGDDASARRKLLGLSH